MKQITVKGWTIKAIDSAVTWFQGGGAYVGNMLVEGKRPKHYKPYRKVTIIIQTDE